MGQHDHSWAEDMDEVQALCPDHNPLLAEAGLRCPGDEPQVIPAKHDAAQYAVMEENARAESQLWALRDKMHAMAGDKRERIGRGYQWKMSWGEVGSILSAMVRDGDADDFRHGGRPSQLLAQDGALLAKIGELDAREEALEATWKTARWTRWYPCLNRDGHIHRSLRGCESVYADTEMGWETSLSGMTVEEAIARLGPRLCSKCFPDAPSEWCRSLADINRERNAAAKAARAEAKFAKRLRPAEEFRDHRRDWVETVARCKEILRDEVELRDYFGRGEHPWHAASVDAAQAAARVLLAREEATPGTGASQAEIDRIIEASVKKNRKAGARI